MGGSTHIESVKPYADDYVIVSEHEMEYSYYIYYYEYRYYGLIDLYGAYKLYLDPVDDPDTCISLILKTVNKLLRRGTTVFKLKKNDLIAYVFENKGVFSYTIESEEQDLILDFWEEFDSCYTASFQATMALYGIPT